MLNFSYELSLYVSYQPKNYQMTISTETYYIFL